MTLYRPFRIVTAGASVIKGFGSKATEDIFNGVSSKRSRKALPVRLHSVAVRKLDMIIAATKLDDLRVPPANYLEALTKDRAGQNSIRINDQYRICFVWNGSEASGVEIVDYH